ncbi:MBL fold metallo-hydrolase [Microbulbifer sp. CnH-101-G]|uniref:MBL fold metallo-hydrolase n=1 Tax=Microbulbifer sp. CnH-101-G TaxID=3243393 RepID=UPI0040397B25
MEQLDIVRIPIFPLGMINAHLILGSDSKILVDSGVPGSEEKIGRSLSRLGLSFKDIDLIVVTHAHADHAGSAGKLQQLCAAPILAHRGDLAYFQQEKAMTYCATGWFGRLLLKSGMPLRPYDQFTPDILLKDQEVFDLSEFGISGVVFSTPGHTQGSISITLSVKRALVGDLVASGIFLGGIMLTGRARQPPFEENPVEVARQLLHLLDKGHETFYLGHGGPLPAREVRRYAERILGEGKVG